MNVKNLIQETIKVYLESKNLILEGVGPGEVNDAINNKHMVNIWYDDGSGDPNGVGSRYIAVYVYGVMGSGNEVIRAYQVFGPTRTEKPQWKLFRLDRIMRWEKTNKKFNSPVSDWDPSIPKFNPFGDKSMGSVYNIVKFENKN
jgi:hypothetical protein